MKKVIWGAIICGLIGAAALSAAGWYGLSLWRGPTGPTEAFTLKYTVKKGQTLTQIATDLEAAGIVKSAPAVRAWARLAGNGDQIQAGEHLLSSAQTVPEVLATLSEPPEQVTITILPGWRRGEIAEYLSQQNLTEFDPDEFLDLTADLEGQLMPETYKIAPLSTTQTIVNVLHGEYRKQVLDNAELQAQVAASGRTMEEILTVASLLQREGREPDQLRMIAGIIYARLADNYPLQLCATAQYASGRNPETGRWWDPPTLAETQLESAYNTYVVTGLPPGPISSVSLAALRAAVDPTSSDYYYYLHDDEGGIHYGVTLADHQRNIELYL